MARLSSLSNKWSANSGPSKTTRAVGNSDIQQSAPRPDTKARFNFEAEATSPVSFTETAEDIDNIVLNEECQVEPPMRYESRWSTTTRSLNSSDTNELYPGELDEYTESSSRRRSKRLSAAIRKGLPARHDLTDLLCTAAINGDVQMIGRIQSAGGDAAKKNSDGLQPIHLAAMANQVDAVRALVLSGADINAKDSAGRTALHHAAKLSSDIFQLPSSTLASRRSSSSSRQSALRFSYAFGQQDRTCGRRPSHVSLSSTASEEKCSLVEVLVRSGADMEICDRDGNSPLHIAVLTGDIFNINTLLDNGANIHRRNKAGLTPLGVISTDDQRSNEMISRLLLQRGAVVTPVEERGTRWFKRAAL
jgi:ankyrin repeat protein